jgi:circadian clock protein KaiC
LRRLSGSEGMLTGTARLAQVEQEQASEALRAQKAAAERSALERRRRALETQAGALGDELASLHRELARLEETEQERLKHAQGRRESLARSRKAPSQE